jgi:hypothetical protein
MHRQVDLEPKYIKFEKKDATMGLTARERCGDHEKQCIKMTVSGVSLLPKRIMLDRL